MGTFGDGSNRWIPGIRETLSNPVDRATNPADTVAGAADAAALNFDEGVGGLSSLFDSESGNTAGPGQTSAGLGATDNPWSVNIPLVRGGGGPFAVVPWEAALSVIVVVAGFIGLAYLLRPFAEVATEVTD